MVYQNSRQKLNMGLSLELLGKTCCPACRSKLQRTETEFLCVNPSCNGHFPIINGVPILIDEANSLFSLDVYRGRSEVYFRGHGRIITWLAQRLPRIGRNLKASENYKKFAELLNDGQAGVLPPGGAMFIFSSKWCQYLFSLGT